MTILAEVPLGDAATVVCTTRPRIAHFQWIRAFVPQELPVVRARHLLNGEGG